MTVVLAWWFGVSVSGIKGDWPRRAVVILILRAVAVCEPTASQKGPVR